MNSNNEQKISKNEETTVMEYYNGHIEWNPEIGKKRKQYGKGEVEIYTGKKEKVEYSIDQQLLDKCEEIIKIKNKYNLRVKMLRNDNDVVYLIKFYNDKNIAVYSYVTTSVFTALRNALEYYFREEKALLRPFGKPNDLLSVKVTLIDIFVCKTPKKFMDDVREEYIKSNKVSDVYECYNNLFKQYELDTDKSIEYNIYLFENKKKKFLFYSIEDVNDGGIDDYLKQIKGEEIIFDKEKHKFSLLEVFECKFKGQLLIEIDRLLEDKKMINDSYNESNYYIDRKFDVTKLAEIKNKIFKTVQVERICKILNDKTDYDKIQMYVYKIIVGGKEFVDVIDMIDNAMKLENIVQYLYSLEEKIPSKYAKLAVALRKAKYNEIKIEILKKKTDKVKLNVQKWCDEYVEKNKTIEEGLNVETIQIVTKSKAVAMIKKQPKK